jgi:hypothetical protein
LAAGVNEVANGNRSHDLRQCHRKFLARPGTTDKRFPWQIALKGDCQSLWRLSLREGTISSAQRICRYRAARMEALFDVVFYQLGI